MYSYSQRLSWSFSSNKLSERIARKRAANIPLLDLTISNPTRVLPNYPHSEISAAHTYIKDFAYDPEAFGDLRARRTIASYYAEKGIRVSESQIALTASTSEAYSLLFKLLCDPGDEILIPVPSYPLFEYLAALESVRTVPYRLHYAGDWFIDFDELQDAITPRTRAIVVVNPSNPAGCYSKEHEARALLDLAAKHRLPVLVDEVFFDYPLPQSGALPPSYCAYDHTMTFVLNGLSKLAGMPQMKLGWMVLNGPPEQQVQAHNRLELILDTYLSVGTPVQIAAPQLFQIGSGIRRELQERIRDNLTTAETLLRGSAINCLNVEAGWSAILQLPGVATEEQWALGLLEEASIVVQPGYFFDMPSEPFIVVSLISQPDIFAQGMEAIRSFATSMLK